MKKSLLIVIAVVIAWFVVSEAATEGWYAYREKELPQTQPWKINLPESEEEALKEGFLNYSVRDLGDQIKEALHYENGKSAQWRDAAGNGFNAFMIDWLPDNRKNDTDLYHNPTTCLVAVGLELEEELPDTVIELVGDELRFKTWKFSNGSRPLFVFTASRRGREFEEVSYSGTEAGRRDEKWNKVFQGRRGNVLETLQIAVSGVTGIEDARIRLRAEITKLQ